MRETHKPGTIAHKWEQRELARRRVTKTTTVKRPIKLRKEHRIPDDLSIPEFLRRAA